MNVDMTPEGRYLLDFHTRTLPRYETGVLVIGGGIAGLSAALAAAENGARVTILLKDNPGVCNTAWAQGGIAAAVGHLDSPARHAEDTLRTGCGLCHERIVRDVTGAAPAAIAWLVGHGAQLDRENGDFALGQEGGHTMRRILHHGDETGIEIQRALLSAVEAHPSIETRARMFVVDLLTEDGCCVGALGHTRDGALHAYFAPAVVLAAGGAGRLYRETSNVRGATGDGIAAAYRAGAEIQDVEFVQFHPTTLYLAGSERVLVTEAVRGEGARVVDNLGRRFLPDVHPDGELAPRDVVSLAIQRHLARDDVTGIYLDLRHWERGTTARRFPGLAKACERYGLDPERDLISVRPAAHYFIGGVRTAPDGTSSVPGLFACGEAACSGLHGANRIASNSLLEGLVLGQRSGRTAAQPRDAFRGHVSHRSLRSMGGEVADQQDLRKALLSTMWRMVGIIRTGPGLEEAASAIRLWRRFSSQVRWQRRAGFELENLQLLGALVTAAARRRQESRGTHGRSDFPERDDARFKGSFVWRADGTAEFRAWKEELVG